MIMFANGGGCAPPPPRCFKATLVCSKQKAWCRHHVCSEGRLCGSFCLQMGGAAPLSTPSCFYSRPCCHSKTNIRPSPCSQQAKKLCRSLKPAYRGLQQEASCHQHVWSEGSLCDLFGFSCAISRICLNSGSWCKGGMHLHTTPCRILNNMVALIQVHLSVSTST